MTDFSSRGFLAEHFEEAIDSKREEWSELYEIAIQTSDYAWVLQSDLRIENTDLIHLVGATLFARTVSVAQAFILIVPKGMKQELKVLIRCLLEPLFPLVAASKDEGFCHRFVASGEIERKKKLRGLLDLHAISPLESLDPDEIQSKIQESEEKIKRQRIKKVSVFDAAQVAGLEDRYKSLYSLMSDTLHASPKALEELMVISDDRTKVEALQNLPDFSEHSDLLTTVIDGLLHAIVATSEIFDLEVAEFVEAQSRKLSELRADGA
jgi:hypothetical protein